MSTTQTVSRVLLSSSGDAPRALLRKWADHAAANGGSFFVKQEFSGNWFEVWTINWPAATQPHQGADG